MIHCVNLGPQSLLAASTSLKYTDTEANQDYEVLTQHKHNYWEHCPLRCWRWLVMCWHCLPAKRWATECTDFWLWCPPQWSAARLGQSASFYGHASWWAVLLRRKNKKDRRKAGLHKTLSASKAIFLSNTAQKCYGRRQPYHSTFSCLGIKIFTFEMLCSFATWVFLCGKECTRRNTLCISRGYSDATEKKTGAKPNNVLWNPA